MPPGSAVASPCRNICTLDRDRRICLGCRRTLDEIGRWSQMSDAERRTVLDRLAATTRHGTGDRQPR